MNKCESKNLFTQTLILLLIISCAYTVLADDVNAQVVTPLATNSLAVMNQVAGINLANYTVTPPSDTAGSYLGLLPTDNIQYNLKGAGSQMTVGETFANGSLLIMDVLENVGSPHLTSTKSLFIPINFLTNYETYSGNPFYGQLAAMLEKVSANENSTTIVGNVQMNITVENSKSTNLSSFTWSYISNGINVPLKCVSLVYQNGALKEFIDTWSLYQIGETTVNISMQQAENTAMSEARNFSWNVGWAKDTHLINKFNVTKPMVEQLVFYPVGTGPEARNSAPLMLYPMWRIGIGLDKFYPGNVYGVYVDVWADSGQIRDTQEAVSSLPPPPGIQTATITESSQNNQSTTDTMQSNVFLLLIVPAAFAMLILTVPIGLSVKKKSTGWLRSPGLHKARAIFLCLLISLTVVVALAPAAPSVSASGASQLWADSCSAGDLGIHSWSEINTQQQLTGNISSWYASDGYASFDEFGATFQSSVLNAVQSADQLYPSVSTLWFDHGVGSTPLSYPYQKEFHYQLCDSDNVPIFDYQIYGQTSNNKNYFSYISACLSADLNNGNAIDPTYTGSYGANSGGSGNPIGMPFAWTHENCSSNPQIGYMSLEGMNNPDSGPYCYIGFPWGSASLSQTLANNNPSTYGMFIYEFYNYALVQHYSVHSALDAASSICFNCLWINSPLATGFIANWYQMNPQSGCTMVVYGNGNIYLYSGSPDYVSTPSISDNVPNPGVAGQQYQFSASATDPYLGTSLTYTFNYGDGSSPTTQSTHIYTSDGVYTVTVTAQSTTGISSSSSTTVTIGSVYQTEVDEYVTPDGANWYYQGTYYINEPAGSNYLGFYDGSFVQAYDYYDGTLHTMNPDWYNLGTGTTISVGYWW